MIEFNDNKPIYRQIVDYASANILSGAWKGGEMIPSVRELTGELGVNSRTVMKALDTLQSLEVIEPKRGMGFRLSEQGAEKMLAIKREEFFADTLPHVIEQMKMLCISPQEVINRLKP